jgi:hypothetical protein
VHSWHPQSASQLRQFSQAGSQIPSPQVSMHSYEEPSGTQASVQSEQPQSWVQLKQFSQIGSHVPSPHAGTHAPLMQFWVQVAQPQSFGHVLQFSPQSG